MSQVRPLLLVALCLPLTAAAEAPATSRVCIAPVPEPGTKSAVFEGFVRTDLPYEIRIDGNKWLRVPRKSGFWLTLETGRSHLVEAKRDGKRNASFTFTFESFDVPGDLCLFLNSFYDTWQLWSWRQTGRWCNCKSE